MKKTQALLDLVRDHAQSDPDNILYRYIADQDDAGETLTIGTLDTRARALASWVQAQGAIGKPVLLSFLPGPEFIIAFWGCIYGGAIAVPVQGSVSQRDRKRVAAIAADCCPFLALSSKRSGPRGKDSELDWKFIEEVDLSQSELWKAPTGRGHGIAYLQYTSGSTAAARGVMISHQNVCANLEYIANGFKFDAETVSVSWLPHFHDMGLVYGILQPLYSGFPCVLMSPAAFVQNPLGWLRAISRFKATHSGGPNFAYDLCTRHAGEDAIASLDLSTWRIAFNGAETVRAETIERFSAAFNRRGFRKEAFYPAYGLAEATLKVSGPVDRTGPLVRFFDLGSLRRNVAIKLEPEVDGAHPFVSCGTTAGPTLALVVDPTKHTECPPGQIGEIWVAGPGVARGYWRRSQESKETFWNHLPGRKGRYLRTGDLGVVDESELFVTGRLKELIIIRGQNFYPADLELTAANACPVLNAGLAAAFAVEGENGESVVLVHELRRVSDFDIEQAAIEIRRAIATEHGLSIKSVIFVAPGSIPRTSSGKVQRNACRCAYLGNTLKIVAAWHNDAALVEQELLAAEPALELLNEMVLEKRTKLLASYFVALLAEITNVPVEAISTKNAAIGYGLDSIAAARIQRRIRADLRLELGLTEILSSASIDELLDLLLARLQSPPASRAVKASRNNLSEQARSACSPEQERLWLLDQIEPGYCAHHLVIALKFQGELRPDLLAESLGYICDRHEPLRTRFTGVNGLPVQIIDMKAPMSFAFHALDSLSPDELANIARCKALTPVVLEEGPLLRATLVQSSRDSHVLLLMAHHIIMDGFSFGLLVRELVHCYQAFLEGRVPSLAALPCRYIDCVNWWKTRELQSGLQKDLDYWRVHLAGAVPDPGLALDRARPLSPPLASAQRVFFIEQNLLEKLRDRSIHAGTTLFMTVAAAFAALLHLCSGREDILFGFPTSGRVMPEMDVLVGQFAYPLVLRVRVSSDLNFRELLERVKISALNAYAHSDVPFARIINAAGPQHRDGFNSLFRTMIGLLKDPIGVIESANLTVTRQDLPVACSDCDLFLTLLQERDCLRGLLTYNEKILEASTVDSLIGVYLRILQEGASNPLGQLSALSLPDLWTKLQTRKSFDTSSNMAIAATFTAEPVHDVLKFWANEMNHPLFVEFAPYNQVFQQLLDPGSIFFHDRRTLNVVLLRSEDLSGRADLARELEHNYRQLVAAVRSYASFTSTPLIVCLCSPSEAGQRDVLVDGLRDIGNVHFIDSSEISRLYPVTEQYDRYGDEIAHIPFTHEQFVAVGTVLARKLASIIHTKFKVLVLDCDQTLWAGVCGETGPKMLTWGKSRRWLHNFVLAKRDAGILLCLCSRNNVEDVEAVFNCRPDLRLRLEHFIAKRINWRAKSENLHSLAEELQIGLDCFVFIDDNPVECAEVRANCPQVLTIQLPADEDRISDVLQHVWPLDILSTTEEDRGRAAFYAQNEQREKLAHGRPLEAFLTDLQLEVRICKAAREQYPRISQLSYRTTQFNLSGRKWTEQQLDDALKNGYECLVVYVSDRFGHYGLVGIVVFEACANALVVDTFAVSCRALGRRVEHKLLASVGEIALSRGLATVELVLIPTQRNKPAQEFMNRRRAGEPQSLDGKLTYRLPAAELAVPEASMNESTPTLEHASALKSATGSGGVSDTRWRRKAEEIAIRYNDVSSIMRAMSSSRSGRRYQAKYVPPRTETERILTNLWSEVLAVDNPGVHDNFFHSGGHSLHAAQMAARIREAFDVDFPLKIFFSITPTIEGLSEAIESLEIAAFGAQNPAEALSRE